jgi:hypothetical protein
MRAEAEARRLGYENDSLSVVVGVWKKGGGEEGSDEDGG